MIEYFFKVSFICVSLAIFWQDYKQRAVYWFLYPILGIISALLFLRREELCVFMMNFVFNFGIIFIILLSCWIYFSFRKKVFINSAIGTGDILLFFCLCTTYKTHIFIPTFVFSLLFSLILHLALKLVSDQPTVPLAGYIVLFYSGLYLISMFSGNQILF